MSDKKQPWMKFYPADWRADPALRVCSIGARGLWMEMLCLMHEAEPRGSLVIGTRPVSVAQLAGLVGASARAVQALFDELDAAGVFSRDGDVIFSRRIRRDVEKAERDKANGRFGGNPMVKGGVNPPVKGSVKRVVKAQKPEARSQNNTSLREEAREARDVFDREFWPNYPNKVGKPTAEAAFAKLYREMAGIVAPILCGLERYIRDKPADRPWLNPATFLNQRRFEDSPATPPARAGPASRQRGRTVAEMAQMDLADEFGFPNDPRSDPRDSTAESAGDPDPSRRGFAGRLSVEDAEAARRDALVDP